MPSAKGRSWLATCAPRCLAPSRSPSARSRAFLALLNTADGRAIASYGDWAWRGRAVWWLKGRIDRRFVRRFDAQ